MISKKIKVWLPLLFSITMIIGMYLGYKMRDNMPGKSFFFMEKPRPVQEIMDLISNRYVDDVKINDLADTAIQAMLSKLDPHSVYIPASELQQVNEELAGKFFGIGIEFNIFEDTLNVINVLKDGPGFKAGLLTGDKFIKVDDSIVAGNKTKVDTYRNLLRGDRGAKVTITYLRNNNIKKAVLTRDAIPLSSVDASYMIDSVTGFIKLNKFTTETYREFMLSLEALNKAGMKNLVLDLRDNGGGILEEAIEIADEFLDGDKLITYTEGKHVTKKEYRCRRVGQFEKGPLIILADEGTASASEVLIGALQDWDRATIIGRRTFGKGLVQEQFELSDHSALRLTIARYFTPVGRSIQRSYANGSKAYYQDIINRHDGDTSYTDTAKKITGKIFRTMGGKVVYGKGGITPDYFIPVDTAGFTKNSIAIYNNGTIGIFAYHYYLQNLNNLNTYKTPEAFTKNFVLTDEDWKQFVLLAAKDSIDISITGKKEKDDLVTSIKSSIARQLWRTEGYFETMNATDPAVQKALEILKK
ncbi:MAG TPA: S41 family peptidase [Ferruginibacter sp.]|nr:S41 family peptidase [Ferruginibacter sp.]